MYYCKNIGKYRARIKVGGKKVHIGYFFTPEEAQKIEADAKELAHNAKAFKAFISRIKKLSQIEKLKHKRSVLQKRIKELESTINQ